jgi:hypothetical protein
MVTVAVNGPVGREKNIPDASTAHRPSRSMAVASERPSASRPQCFSTIPTTGADNECDRFGNKFAEKDNP